MEEETRPKVLRDVDKTLDLNRFSTSSTVLLLLYVLYIPFGLLLVLLRACISLQTILLLLLFPEGTIKRFLLRIPFAVLGIVVITKDFHKKSGDTKVFVSNRLSWMDHLVLHLAFDCITVSTHGKSPPLSCLVRHQTFQGKDEDAVQAEARRLPDFDESVSLVDFTPHVVQPEFMPTNGSHMLLQFSSWPFALDSTVQPIKLSAWRPFGINVTTAESSGWWDLLWLFYSPFTVFSVKLLPSLECEAQEMPQEFARRVQYTLATEMGIQGSEVTQEDVAKWIADPPRPPPPPPPPPPQASLPKGPIIPESEFPPTSSFSSLSPSSDSSPEMETMVRQVIAVLPQVPHTTIRKDLLKTDSVDLTITNLLEGKVPYDPITTFQQQPPPSSTTDTTSSLSAKTNSSKPSPSATASLTTSSSTGRAKAGPGKKTASGTSSLFPGVTSPALMSMMRQMSLEERKQNLLEQAKRRYIEKHGLS